MLLHNPLCLPRLHSNQGLVWAAFLLGTGSGGSAGGLQRRFFVRLGMAGGQQRRLFVRLRLTGGQKRRLLGRLGAAWWYVGRRRRRRRRRRSYSHILVSTIHWGRIRGLEKRTQVPRGEHRARDTALKPAGEAGGRGTKAHWGGEEVVGLLAGCAVAVCLFVCLEMGFVVVGLS